MTVDRSGHTSRSRSRHTKRYVLGRAVMVVWLTLVWAALWESLSPAVLVSGVSGALVLIAMFPQSIPRTFGHLHPLKALRFVMYFAYRLILANLIVAWEIVTPKNRINQGVVEVPVKGASDSLVTILANAISLTPGTITVEVRRDPPTLYIHVLHLKNVEEVRRDVERLERLVLEAFGGSMPEVWGQDVKHKKEGIST